MIASSVNICICQHLKLHQQSTYLGSTSKWLLGKFMLSFRNLHFYLVLFYTNVSVLDCLVWWCEGKSPKFIGLPLHAHFYSGASGSAIPRCCHWIVPLWVLWLSFGSCERDAGMIRMGRREMQVQPDRSPSQRGTGNTCSFWQRLKERHPTVRLLLCLGIWRWGTGWWQWMKRCGLNQMHGHTLEVWFWSGF